MLFMQSGSDMELQRDSLLLVMHISDAVKTFIKKFVKVEAGEKDEYHGKQTICPAEPPPLHLNICDLPCEVLYEIFKHLPSFKSLGIVMRVCKLWNQIGGTPVLWQHLHLSFYKPGNLLLGRVLSFSRFKCLRRLQILGTTFDQAVLDDSQVSAISSSGLRLKLTLRHCSLSSISDTHLVDLIKSLRSLILFHCEMTPHQTRLLLTSLRDFRRLEELDLGYSDLSLRKLEPALVAEALTSVRALNMGQITTTEEHLKQIFTLMSKKRSRLRVLDLGYCSLVGMEDLVRGGLARLKRANICRSKIITTPYMHTYT